MASAGMTIGSHGGNHQILSVTSATDAECEIVSSRALIEREIRKPCWCFAYPNGSRSDFRRSDEVAISNAGYVCAFTQIPGVIDRRTQRFALPRIPIPDIGDQNIFTLHASGARQMIASALRV